MKKLIKLILFLSVIIYITIGTYFYIIQDSLVYNPKPKAPNTLKEKIFKIDGELIHATLVNSEKDIAIIYFGGNAEDVDYNYSKFSKVFSKYTVYLVQYRGFANSSGIPTEKNLYSDALYIYDYLKKKYKSITVIGRSLGSGVATYLASKREVKKLILVTPFDSIENIAKSRFNIYPISLMLRDKFDSLSRIKDIKSPTLIIYAQNDETVKKERTDNLVKEFPNSQLIIKTVKDAGHSSILEHESYYIYMKEFL
ncbi:MAG: alpha/beta hydrolase [Thiovulaceae bacterium]|nr:alpha/beta hydrolase [Sulfurimonadaceae bacterium]MCW9026402.1 alpha/beta hydrolase [Sulfurimonadaceae bacterium]